MPRFRFYITDLFEGEMRGTNDPQIAKDCACCEEYFVLDTAPQESLEDTDPHWMLTDAEGNVSYKEIPDYNKPADEAELPEEGEAP